MSYVKAFESYRLTDRQTELKLYTMPLHGWSNTGGGTGHSIGVREWLRGSPLSTGSPQGPECHYWEVLDAKSDLRVRYEEGPRKVFCSFLEMTILVYSYALECYCLMKITP